MRSHALVLIGVCLLTFFAGLGAPAIADSDEAFYAESAREMLELGDWLTPHFNYIYRFEKPILYYWLVASTYVLAGVSEATARFPSAVAGLGLTLLTFAAGRRWFDAPTALLAGLITATSFGYITMARQALPDLTLAFFITLATWASLVAWIPLLSLDGKDRAPAIRTGWVMVAALGVAGAFLTKGPIGVALPALVVGPIVVWNRWIRGAPLELRTSELAVATGLAILIVAPWYLAMTFEHGFEYLDRFFIAENLDRFATARYNSPRPAWYYLPIVVGGLLPWSPFMLLWAPMIRRAFVGGFGRRATTEIVLAWWALAPLAFYTLSVGKQPRYILPILPPLAILIARALRGHIVARHASGVFKVATGIAGISLAAMGVLLFRAQALLIEWSGVWLSVAATAIVTSGFVVIACIRRPRRLPIALVASSVVVALTAHWIVLASPRASPVERIAALLADERAPGATWGRYRVLNRNLIFYARAPFVELPIEQAVLDYLARPDRVLCVLPVDHISRLKAKNLIVRSLGEVSYLDTGNLTLRILLDPNPERYLQRVALVTNR